MAKSGVSIETGAPGSPVAFRLLSEGRPPPGPEVGQTRDQEAAVAGNTGGEVHGDIGRERQAIER